MWILKRGPPRCSWNCARRGWNFIFLFRNTSTQYALCFVPVTLSLKFYIVPSSLSLSLSLSISLSGSNLNDFEVRSCVCFYKCSSRFAYSRPAQPFSLLPPPSSSESCHFNPLVSCLNEIFNKLVTRAPAVASSQPRQHNKSSTNVLGGWSPGFLTPALARFSYFTPSNSLGTPAKFSHVLPTTLFRHQLVES